MPKKSSLTSFVNLNPTLIMDPSQFQLSIHPQSPFLILLSTDTVNTLNHFLIRASIYVENPIHQFKSYSIDEFNQLKVTEYHGHNLSLKLLSQFFASTKLSSAEIQLKNWFVRKKWLHPVTSRCLTSTAESMYLLGWVRTHVSVARHELHHAIYFFHPEYRRGVSSIWNTLTPMAKRQVISYLSSCGYNFTMYEDEFQAHLGNNEEMMLAQEVVLKEAKVQLEKLKLEYEEWFKSIEIH